MALTLSGNVLSKISFCDKQCSNINDNKFKAQIIQNIDEKYKIQIVSRDYNILNPNILRNVSYHQHILACYTNGNPYMLYLTKIDGINCCIFIDKKLKDGYTYPKMHCVKYRFSNKLFEEDTIFTGELVRDNERRWIFLIDNILLYKGMSTVDKNIISRFELIYNIMNNEYTLDKYLEICPLQIKKLFLYKDIKKFITEYIPNLSYVCKGIILYTLNNKHSNYAYVIPRDSQIQVKTSSEIDELVQDKYPELWEKKNSISNNINISNFINESKNDSKNDSRNDSRTENKNDSKNESRNESKNESENKLTSSITKIEPNNVVFKVLKTDMPDIYNLYCTDDKENLIKHSIALIPNIKISHNLFYTLKSKPNNLGMNIECRFSKIFEKWIPLKFVDNTIYSKNSIDSIETLLKNNN